MITTRFTRLVGCRAPIQQAPNGDYAGSPRLPIAVARAGGHGMLAAVSAGPDELLPALEEAAAGAGEAWGVNVVLPMTPADSIALAAERAPLVDFHQGDPDSELVEMVHRGGGLASWQIGTSSEARAAERAGCDMVIAQGVDAAGYTRGKAGTMALLQETLEAVSIPPRGRGLRPSRRSRSRCSRRAGSVAHAGSLRRSPRAPTVCAWGLASWQRARPKSSRPTSRPWSRRTPRTPR